LPGPGRAVEVSLLRSRQRGELHPARVLTSMGGALGKHPLPRPSSSTSGVVTGGARSRLLVLSSIMARSSSMVLFLSLASREQPIYDHGGGTMNFAEVRSLRGFNILDVK
jgi:hypothetical protein